MILSIDSSLSTFKSLRFHTGLNVLLADTKPDSTEKQTRNSAGKTSLVEIIHFLYGANCDKTSLFRTDALINHRFLAKLRMHGKILEVSRTGSDPSKIIFEGGDKEFQNLFSNFDKKTNRRFISNVKWRVFLGHILFGMPADVEGTSYNKTFTPSFRSMFSYFARRRNSGAFTHPERNSENQQRWDWQVNLSYLFGLDWSIPFEFQKVRVRERTLEELKRATKAGSFGELIGTVAELRPQVTVAESRARRLSEQLANFEVLDSYLELSRDAARAKAEMQAIGRQTVILNETLEHLTRALDDEGPPSKADLERLYEAAGVELPDVALRRFEEVERFYESVVDNRRKHLLREVEDVKAQLSEGEGRLAALDRERGKILRMLEGRGALGDFLELQRRLAHWEASAAALRERFKAAEVLEGETTQLAIDRANLKRRLQEDHRSRQELLDEPILIVADMIGELYDDRSGHFVVDATDNGPEFRISIEGDRGGGISNMEVFCFDLALFRVVSERLGGPGFLLHDSHLFDGVDERQIARALTLGSNAADGEELQYIVTMNSDIFDRLPLADEIDLSKRVLPVRLSDEKETGGLFGFRFE